MSSENLLVIDATGAVLGRLASFAAKQALKGKSIIIVNCGEALITGRRQNIIEEYKAARQRGGSSHRGPFFPKYPDRLVKRIIRGMLPPKKDYARGVEALKRVKCYNDVPKEYEHVKKLIAGKEKKVKTMKLSDLSREL